MTNKTNVLISLTANNIPEINNNLKKLILSVSTGNHDNEFNVFGVVSRISNDSSFNEISSKGIQIIPINAKNIIRKIINIRNIINKNNIHIIHCAGYKDLLFFYIGSIGISKKPSLILSDRATDRWDNFVSKILTILILCLIKPNIHVLNKAHYHYLKKYRFLYKDIALINNSINSDSQNTINNQKINNNLFNICYIKSIRADTGHDDIISLGSKIKKKNLKILIHIVGNGVLYEDFKQKILDNNLNEIIKTYGLIKNDKALTLLSKMDLGITTSPMEMMPNFLLECFSVGVPAIGYKTQGVEDVITNDVNGYLIDLGNVTSFLDHIEILMNNSQLLTFFSNNSLLRKEDFTYKSIGEQVIAFYHKIIGDLC